MWEKIVSIFQLLNGLNPVKCHLQRWSSSDDFELLSIITASQDCMFAVFGKNSF